MKTYIVRQGDHLASIAWRAGVEADAIWNHPANASIKQLRRDPNILAPGDVLTLPDSRPKKLTVSRGTNNRFVAQVPRVTLRVSVGDAQGPWAGEAWRAEGLGGAPVEGTTDGQGVATIEVPVDAASLQLVLPGRHRRMRLDVGHLDPISEDTGVRARLEHLGYLQPQVPGQPDGLNDSVSDFQTASGLEPTGELDDATQSKLTEVHGS